MGPLGEGAQLQLHPPTSITQHKRRPGAVQYLINDRDYWSTSHPFLSGLDLPGTTYDNPLQPMDGINITLSAQVYSFFSFTESDALSWRNIMAMVNRIRQLKQLVIVTEQMWLWWLLKKNERYTLHARPPLRNLTFHLAT